MLKKYLVSGAILVLVALSACSSTSNTKPQSVTKKPDICKLVSDLAEVTMKSRQRGIPLHKIIESANSVNDHTPEGKVVSSLRKSLAIEAYKTPRFQTAGYINRSIEKFRDKNYLICISTMKK